VLNALLLCVSAKQIERRSTLILTLTLTLIVTQIESNPNLLTLAGPNPYL